MRECYCDIELYRQGNCLLCVQQLGFWARGRVAMGQLIRY
jgi:hypothetical protein